MPSLRLRAVLWLSLIFPALSQALPERTLSIGLGGGLPGLVSLNAQVMATPHWQLGFAFGLLSGGGLGGFSDVTLPSQQYSALGFAFEATPVVSASMQSMMPYVRFYPTDTNFYLEVSCTLLRLNAGVTTTLKSLSGGPDLSAYPMEGLLSLLQTLPTFSMGHSFRSQLFFIDFSLGLTVVGPIFTSVSSSSNLGAVLGQAGAQTLVDQMSAGTTQAAQGVVSTFRHDFPLIPSFNLIFGIII